MDIITHALSGILFSRTIKNKSKKHIFFIILGSIIPDIGEIPIQLALTKKLGETNFVYDNRTSDLEIANNLKFTWLYDLTHSIIFSLFFILIGLIFIFSKNIKINNFGNILKYFGFGIIIHIFLDSFTHGKIWALKLLFPVSNYRFKILENTIGNWWDWIPKIKIVNFELPLFCFIFWLVLILAIFLLKIIKS